LPRQLWYRFCQRTLQLAWVLLYRVRRSGIHNIPAEGAVVLAPNHQSHYDPPLVGCCCPRRMSYLARASLFDFAPFAWLIHSLGAFPIDRDTSKGLGGIKETLRRLKKGEVIMMFPEGARTADGEIHKFNAGIRTLATRSKATIVPVAIEGAYQAWPRWRKFPRLGTIHIHYGEALRPEQIQELGEDALVEEIERRVRRYHAELCSHPAIARMRREHRA
jgi:1-acyl-sn-glycerol-3-phosphate acyltransferase